MVIPQDGLGSFHGEFTLIAPAKLPDTIPVTEFERITGQMAWMVDYERVEDRS